MNKSVIELLTLTTLIVLPLLAWFVVHSPLKRVWRGIRIRDLLVGAALGIPVVFLLYALRGYSVNDTWHFLVWYGGGFLYHWVVLSLWIRLFRRISLSNSGQVG